MKLRSKSYLFIGSATLVLVVVSMLASLYAFRSYSLDSVREQGQMAAELVLNTLTQEMMSGNMGHHEELIMGLKKTPGLKDIEVVPSEIVIEQYGQRPGDTHVASPYERQAMDTGRMVESLDETSDEVIYHVAIPYIASSAGEVNCIQCHDVVEGTVLGAVGLSIDMTEQRAGGIAAISLIAALILLFGGFIAFIPRWLLKPVIDTTAQLKEVVEAAGNGDFSGRLIRRTNDEVGEIAIHANHLMTTLEKHVGGIFRQVATLVGHDEEGRGKGNLLKRTAGMVTNMVEASHFKHAIENDRDLDEVYARLQRTLKNHFGLGRFSMYEVNNSKNRLKLIFSEGLPRDCDLWCKQDILVQSEACRCARTALLVSSIDEPEICPYFAGNNIQEEAELLHICLPLMLGSSVGGVLQLVFSPGEAEKVQDICGAIRTYLNEAAPVVEAKRLAMSLRESAMRDAMTGLYNRRFLEEYLETLTADVARRKVSVGILMCDVDFFKQVNDALGHEVGDAVLKSVADILRQAVRASDFVIRYGGEEFLALLIDSDESKTMEVAERIRSNMEESSFKTASGPLSKTLSVGVSMYPDDTDGFWGAVKFADVALYKAKETGRNKVLRFTKDMWNGEEEY